MIIGISGNATAGKDTLYNILEKILYNKFNISTFRIALADPLKLEINDFCRQNYNISSFTKSLKEKEMIRPFMVFHGKMKREITNGKYWTNLAQQKVDTATKDGYLPIITDIRYSYYSEDETFWLKSVNNGVLLNVIRFDSLGNKIAPANSDEAENESKIISASDFSLKWSTSNNIDYLYDLVELQLKDLINLIGEKYATK
jgi:hypothetical protein